MIDIIGSDLLNYITLFLVNYRDLLSIKLSCKRAYFHNYEHREIEIHHQANVQLPKLEKITIKNMQLTRIPNVKICILIDCCIKDSVDVANLEAIYIRDCHITSLISPKYTNLVAIYLYNFLIDPDDLILPKLEYLCIYESDYDDSYVYMFDIERFPNLKYLDISRIYIDNDSATIPLLEYYGGYFQQYNMPNLKYVEWNTNLLSEAQFLDIFPSLIAIITYAIPDEPFDKIEIITPDTSKIARSYYDEYFSLKK